jgi:acetyl-CoA carboxylase biotin carboxylase subunit
MIRRLLVANRGEIAVRIVRACREAGVESVAVYSDADAAAPHVVLADRAVRIGPAPAAESYLHAGRIIDAARAAGADAVHPGYGFLAENPAFADACTAAGLIFVGPPADVMARLGAKPAARRLAMQAGVPVVPGLEPDEQSDAALADAARRLGPPLLVKAAAGGGGKGMRLVRSEEEIGEAIGAARREALAAFGDGALYFERLLERPRHVEIQIFADAHGRVVHLFERECSIQRRHQKVVEESPSPALTPGLRARMGEAAVAVARAAGYRNAGTVEFLVEGGGDAARFYFLEMNTRLQVEHPVTEAVTGFDLVRAQLAVAAGEPLPWTQEAIGQRGHAIECRIYAEDPAQGFLPQAGRLLLYREPDGPGIRVDSGVVEGSDIGVQYDPLLAKLVVHAETRAAAIARARTALAQFPILGVATNVSVLRRVLDHPAFRRGTVDAGFLEREIGALLQPPEPDACALAAAAAAIVAGTPAAGAEAAAAAADADPWVALRGWRAGVDAPRTDRPGGG